MSGRGVPDFTIAQNMERIPVYMSRLQLTMDGQLELGDERLRLGSGSRNSYLHQQHNPRLSRVMSMPTYPVTVDSSSRSKAGNHSSKSVASSSKPLKSSLKGSSRKKTAEKGKQEGVDRETHIKAFGSPNSSLESISEKSEPEEPSEVAHNTEDPHVVLVNPHTDSSLSVFSQKTRETKPLRISTLFFQDTHLDSDDDDDNVPLAALTTTKKGFAGQPTEKVNLQTESSKQYKFNKTSERVRSVSFSAHTEFIPNEMDFCSDDDASSIHSRRRTCSYDNISEISNEGAFDSNYNVPRSKQFGVSDNVIRREAFPHPNMKSSSRYHNPKYLENDNGIYYENTRPLSAYFTTASTDRLVDMAPLPTPHRYGSDGNLQSRANTPLINHVHHKQDRYSGIYTEPSDSYFANGRASYHGMGASHPSLSRVSSVRSTSSTTSLPAAMYSFAGYGNRPDSSITSHRNSIRGLNEIRPSSISRGPTSPHRVSNVKYHTDMGRAASNPRGKSLR